MKAALAGWALVLFALPLAGWAVAHGDRSAPPAMGPGHAPFVTVPLTDGGPAIAGPSGQTPPLWAVAGDKLSPNLVNALLSAPADAAALPLLVDLVPPEGMLSMGGDFYAPHLTQPRPEYPADILGLIRRESRGETLTSGEQAHFRDWALKLVLANNRALAGRHLAEWAPLLAAVPGVSNVLVPDPAFQAYLTLAATPEAVARLAAMPEVAALVLDAPMEVRPLGPLDAAPSPAETLNG